MYICTYIYIYIYVPDLAFEKPPPRQRCRRQADPLQHNKQ